MLTLLYTDKGARHRLVTLKAVKTPPYVQGTGPKLDITLWIMESDSDETEYTQIP